MERKVAKDGVRRHLGRPVTRRRACFELFVRLVVVLSLVGAMFMPKPEHQRTHMPETEVLDESPDSCVAVSTLHAAFRVWMCLCQRPDPLFLYYRP